MKLLEDRYRGKTGVSLFCVIDPERSADTTFAQIMDWAQRYGLSCPYAADFDNTLKLQNMFLTDYNIRAQFSWFIVIDPEGRVAFNYNHGPGKTAEEQAENLAAMIDALTAGRKGE